MPPPLLLALLVVLALNGSEALGPRYHAPPHPGRGPSMVYTLLGHSLQFQSYVWHSINQTRTMNPLVPIYLVLHRKGYESAHTLIDAEAIRFGVQIDFYDYMAGNHTMVDELEKNFVVVNDMPTPDGNKQFMRFTTERIFAVYFVAEKRNLWDIFHMENDNMMYINLRSAAATMRTCNVGIGLPLISHPERKAGVCFSYFRNAAAVRLFSEYIVSMHKLGAKALQERLHGNGWINEMTITYDFLEHVNKTAEGYAVTMLPTYIIKGNEPPNCIFNDQKMIYDGAMIGQSLNGTHWNPEKRYFYDTGPFQELRNLQIHWEPCKIVAGDLRCPWVAGYPITNLHIHSKKLWYFSSAVPVDLLPT